MLDAEFADWFQYKAFYAAVILVLLVLLPWLVRRRQRVQRLLRGEHSRKRTAAKARYRAGSKSRTSIVKTRSG